MNDADKLSKAEVHLREVWKSLLREQQATLARLVEGVLAELTDDALIPAQRVKCAAGEWRAVRNCPRGLSDFGIWRDYETERLSLNRDFDAHRNAVDRLFA
ncbi:MAG: hypothetical protein KKE02_16950 [Alphaproteobacteria bacterium]|nr:hypothetical protein [Alphaproteobacteria bacterium]MBU1516740.1 hypothetical protein [Alphaproteobacteria bacterium]MBU2092434.1 hypothetical protein [Alphaproteobacteria bacterium]MBU2152712.1 hypothetical protein [Alphaproteobacteria bacterium]MBU2308985.1 hypothetical protein [Alphaproteobacteria bacterium]